MSVTGHHAIHSAITPSAPLWKCILNIYLVLKIWAKSQNRWVKRASAVSLIVPARKGKFLNDIFEIADILLLIRMIWFRKDMDGC